MRSFPAVLLSTLALTGALVAGCAMEGCGSSSSEPALVPVAPVGDAEATEAAVAKPVDAGAAASDAGDAAALVPDPCASAAATCPVVPAGFTAGAGLRVVDRCAFPMRPAAGFASNGAIIDALEKITSKTAPAAVAADGNRVATQVTAVPGAPPGVDYAFRWNAEDDGSTTWIPQGITGTPDADPTGLVGGKRIVLVSFYEDTTLGKGARVAFVDVTNPAAPRYRFALLVEPAGSAAAPSFAPVDSHAGGIVWFGSKLYVAQTGTGFRVFDMSRILEVAVDQDVIGCTATTCRAGLYKYVIPQIGVYAERGACAPIFSWVSLDRSTTPPSLVSGEYCSTTACAGRFAGKALRWPLDVGTDLLVRRDAASTTWPTEAFLLGETQVQGGASRSGAYYLSSSAPAGGGGALYRVKPGKSATSAYADAPEDLMVEGSKGLLWGLTEAAGARVVFAAKLASYPAP